MKPASTLVYFGTLIAFALTPNLRAATLEVPISLDYRILQEALAQQVFTGPEHTAEVFADALRCNTLILSDPRIEGGLEGGVAGGEQGRLRLVTDMRASIGTPLAGKCRFSRAWHGVVETEQTAEIQPGESVVAFRVVDSRLLRADDGEEALPRFMRRWIRDYVHPRLAAVTIDLGPAVRGIEELLDSVLTVPVALTEPPLPDRHWSVALVDAQPTPEALLATLSLDVPDAPSGWAPADEPPLSEAELAAWDAQWQAWDAFATWMIKSLAVPAGPEFSAALAETLLEARYDLRDALATEERPPVRGSVRDPVRQLFLKTWTRLTPLLHQTDLPVPGGQALHFASFVSAGDALRTLDELAPHIGLSIDQDALRSMARMLVPEVSDYDLRYDLAVDPELRALLGLGPPLLPTPLPGDAEGGAAARLLDWLTGGLVPSAQAAADLDPRLVQRLNTWLPERPEIDNYLHTMARLLDAISDAEHEQGKVPEAFLAVYDPLLRATAWQESCWRQYVVRDGEIEPIRSPAGSVGLMQVNLHVWRGVYDADEVLGNVGYNARAGNEILVHYLVDYAIRKNEHEVTGDIDDLARATYAMYNGGPRHLKRYREAKTSASLKKIDTAFWAKFQAIQEEGPLAVRPCLAGG